MTDLNALHGTITDYTSGGFGASSNRNNIKDGNDGTAGTYGAGVTGAGQYRGWECDLGALYDVTSVRLKSGDNKDGTADEIWWSTDGVSWSGGPSGSFGSWDGAGGDQIWTPTSSPIAARYFRYDRMHFGGFGAGLTVNSLELRGVDAPIVPPVADFTAAPRVGPVGTAVTFTDVSTNSPTTWAWDFGDGHTSTAQYPSHTYIARGSYTVSLVATNGGGSDTETKVAYVAIGLIEPVPFESGAAHDVFIPNNPIRAYAWYGDRANRVCIFTGLLDRVHESRDPKRIALKARSRFKWLMEQVFTATASQVAGEAGAVRTEANGVYVGKSPEYIVGDIWTRAGWPAADRDLAASGMTLAEYDLTDKTSWAEQIAGGDRLTTATGFDLWEDELGLGHFRGNALGDLVEPTPDYTLEAGVDVLKLDHEVDDENRATRVLAGGPMTSTVPVWREEWATTALKYPTGTMYRPSEPGYLYAIDSITQYLYKIRQSDRQIVQKWYLGGSLSYYPMGLSGDPTDSSVFWVLDSDWVHGATTHAKVRRYTFATKALAATHSLPDGEWTDLKTDGTNLWLTNFGDDKLYKRSMTGTAVADYGYPGFTNPTGMYLDGTTLGLFFNNGEAFYLVSTTLPGSITGSQSTKGTHILGGESDTTTHADLYATNEAGDFGATAGHIWKFDLADEVTTDVTALAADQALEDDLGFQSGIANRVHDLHPGDAAHPFEIRLATYSMKVVQSLAQAGAMAQAQLVLLSRLRRVMDLACLGNPALQLNDVIRYVDPVAGIDSVWLLDSYRASLAGDGTYITSVSLLPWEAA